MKKVIEAGYGAEGAKQFIKSDSLKVDHTDASTPIVQVSTAQADAQNVIVDHNGNPMSSNANTTSSVPRSVILGPDGKPLGKA